MGFASSPETRNALASHGIRVSGYRWRWALGLKGGTYPPHYHQNNDFARDSGDFEALPGDDVNGSSCNCRLVPQYRDAAGRFAKPGLTPVFQPPVTAAFDLAPLTAALEQFSEREIIVEAPITVEATQVRVPDPPNVYVDAPVINVPEFPQFPDLAPLVAAITSQQIVAQVVIPDGAIVVNVAAPNVTVDAPVTVQPAPVKVLEQPKTAKTVEFRRNANGLIDEAVVTE